MMPQPPRSSVLDPDAARPSPERPTRFAVVGVTGVGKTTLAGRIAKILGIPHTEIDALFHGPNWTPREEFLDDVRALVAQDAWITEWQYSSARPLVAERAQVMVWLDLPYWRVNFWRGLRRTIRRSLTRRPLWNGNVEGPLREFFTDPEHIMRWSLRTRNKYRDLPELVARDYPHLTLVHLRSQAEVERFLQALREG